MKAILVHKHSSPPIHHTSHGGPQSDTPMRCTNQPSDSASARFLPPQQSPVEIYGKARSPNPNTAPRIDRCHSQVSLSPSLLESCNFSRQRSSGSAVTRLVDSQENISADLPLPSPIPPPQSHSTRIRRLFGRFTSKWLNVATGADEWQRGRDSGGAAGTRPAAGKARYTATGSLIPASSDPARDRT